MLSKYVKLLKRLQSMKLIVNEIFYSLQGEGGRCGEASIFIRLTKCNLACDFCDTDFANGDEISVDEIFNVIKDYPSKWIIWTGGEPSLQLKDEHLIYFKQKGYKQAIETNGTKQISSLIDYITCSPKINIEKVKDKIPFAHEIRIPIKDGDCLPNTLILPKADKYFLSPIFDGNQVNKKNVDYCVELIKSNPEWTLSLQIHKLIHIP